MGAYADGRIRANALDLPELIARFALQRHQLALMHSQPGQAYCFRKVFLEHKTEFVVLFSAFTSPAMAFRSRSSGICAIKSSILAIKITWRSQINRGTHTVV